MSPPRILFIDAYDSFSNNIVSLLETTLDAQVEILPIDPPELNPKKSGFAEKWTSLLRHYDAVVCGPGPGSPDSPQDVGLMKYIWELETAHLVPVLGICLGFQSLVVSCGGIVKKLTTGLHGMIRDIDHEMHQPSLQDGNIFNGVLPFKATLYHSLHADIGQETITAVNWATSKWTSPSHLPDLAPLAWVYEDRGDHIDRILMGVKHRTRPFWGLQYHPESICTDSTGHQVIKNWFEEAIRWNSTNGRITNPESVSLDAITGLPHSCAHKALEATTPSNGNSKDRHAWSTTESELASFGIDTAYYSKTISLPIHIETPDIVEILQGDKKDFIILDSASAKANRIGADVRGRYSIIALDVDEALKLEYRTGDGYVTARCSQGRFSPREVVEKIPLAPGQTVWQVVADFWSQHKMAADEHSAPFIGGFMGYTTYELGLEGIDVKFTKEKGHDRPDLCFAWVTKSIVIDHTKGILRIQTLSPSEPEAKAWTSSIASRLSASAIWSDGLRANFNKRAQLSQLTPPSTPKSSSARTQIQVPDAAEYEAKVRTCQDYIAAGDSYELCLTDQTHIIRPQSTANTPCLAPLELGKPPLTSWQLYRSLRSRQPAPFGSYLRLGGATLLSSSPERFLEFGFDTTTAEEGGLFCSMRPMKGTVRKSAAVATLTDAEAILHVPKEEAENLMIVDLVRHDLHGVCGPGRVHVPKLNIVEEYASVFQMISVVEGRLPRKHPDNMIDRESPEVTGFDILAATLPPGSMTGAPKKRSCELLLGIEGTPARQRSLYSGVIGYVDAAGRGDWSVTIRSLFRWDDETVTATGTGVDGQKLEVWHIGAGGAVTALSTPEGEREEMFTKLKGPLGVLNDDGDGSGGGGGGGGGGGA